MTNREIIALQPWLEEVAHLPGLKFAEAIIRIAPVVNKYINDIVEKTKETEEYKKYSKELKELNDKFYERDEKGDVIREIIDGKSVPTFMKGYKKELALLEKSHKDAIKFRDKQKKEFQAILDKKAGVEIELIPRDSLSEQISAAELAGISVIVEK